MREIKFRAWDLEIGAWATHNDFLGDSVFPIKVSASVNAPSIVEFGRNDLILQQSTGLKDQNGREIFEGDIVEFIDQRTDDGEHWKVQQEVKWEHGCFYPNTCIEESEIIGNIYENPELLK